MRYRTIDFFKEIAQIPRESGNEVQIAEYLCEFARARNLPYTKDQYNNVIICKRTADVPAVMLQAHMDMVCEKEPNRSMDFSKEPIEIIEENGYLRANGTTLGADNGIGMAQILNVLDTKEQCNIEAIFTVSEETSMVGAENIDVSSLQGTQMLNLDGFEEHTVLIESAGFWDIVIPMQFARKKIVQENYYQIQLSGLLGGHSGTEIAKNRGNASQLLAELLLQIPELHLSTFIGGTKFNVIPSQAVAIIGTSQDQQQIDRFVSTFGKEKQKLYPTLEFSVTKQEQVEAVLSKEDTQEFLQKIAEFRHGVFYQNTREEVTSSINLGVVDLQEQVLKIGMRSSQKEEAQEVLEYMRSYFTNDHFTFTILSSQPGFATTENAKIVQALKRAYSKIGAKEELVIKSVHVTVETGFFKEKIPNLEVAILSPKILGAHTPKECVSIASVEECDRWLSQVLEDLQNQKAY